MIRYYLAFFIVLFSLSACDRYESPREQDPGPYNETIKDGQKAKAAWVLTPVGIAKYLFPRESHNGGNISYGIKENKLSGETVKITITDEGPMDDDVDGIRRVLYFRLNGNNWVIDKLSISKRRVE